MAGWSAPVEPRVRQVYCHQEGGEGVNLTGLVADLLAQSTFASSRSRRAPYWSTSARIEQKHVIEPCERRSAGQRSRASGGDEGRERCVLRLS